MPKRKSKSDSYVLLFASGRRCVGTIDECERSMRANAERRNAKARALLEELSPTLETLGIDDLGPPCDDEINKAPPLDEANLHYVLESLKTTISDILAVHEWFAFKEEGEWSATPSTSTWNIRSRS